MKKLVLSFIVVLFVAASASAQGVLKFGKEVHDFGTLKEGPNAMASCGCTTPEWKKDPIMPGATAVIKVGYNTSGRPGNFTKTITVTSNAENATVVLTIKGGVTPKATSGK
ncbi:MAG: DUF1573 domain-containing protein [Spirosomaceae bacterium]|nr:DUF1573 domain-containing protein [Spirosomataceae bacterium]